MTSIVPLRVAMITRLMAFMDTGAPYVQARSHSEYWLYSELFASTCLIALDGEEVAGAVIALRGQDRPEDMYVQDVLISPQCRRQGLATRLLSGIHERARELGCTRTFLTSEPGNIGAHQAWLALGYQNLPGDYRTGEMWVIRDYKGPGRARAVYERQLRR